MISVTVTQTFDQKELRALAVLGAMPGRAEGGADGGFAAAGQFGRFLKAKAFNLESVIRANITKRGSGSGDGYTWVPLSPAYAKQKAQGKTKGGAKYGSPAMLRDSGNSVDDIQAVVKGTTIELHVPDLQAMHWTGAGNLPVRSPFMAHDQAAWNECFETDLEKLIAGELAGY